MKKRDQLLVQQVLDGSTSPDDFAAFQNRLREDPELVTLYAGYARLHHTLCEEFEGVKPTRLAQPAARSRRPLLYLILTGAAVLVILALALREPLLRGVTPQAVANASFSLDAVWQIEGTHRTSGSFASLSRGTKLRLEQGQTSITMDSGTTAVIEAPAGITLESGKSMILAEGRGRFRMFGPGGGLKVATPSFTALDLGTEFGIEVLPGKLDELHVIEGKVRMRSNTGGEELNLTGGESVRSNSGTVEKIPSDGGRFLKELGRFHTVFSSPFAKAESRMQYGSPMISEEGIDGGNYAAFIRLKQPEPGSGGTVLLATLETGKPASGDFHTDGWAGMSFFNKGLEVLFFGDAFGINRTWSLDVKQHVPVILPAAPILGPRTVTLRYHRPSGDVSLHEGGVPLGKAFCSGKLPPGTVFDEIRLGASAGAALDVRSLTIRCGGER